MRREIAERKIPSYSTPTGPARNLLVDQTPGFPGFALVCVTLQLNVPLAALFRSLCLGRPEA